MICVGMLSLTWKWHCAYCDVTKGQFPDLHVLVHIA